MSNDLLCKPFYADYIIPRYDNQSSYLFISSLLEFVVFLFLLCNICRKQFYMKIKHDTSKAKAILSPFYNNIIYWYCAVTIIQVIIYGIQFATNNILSDIGITSISIISAISDVGEISLEIFIPLLLMQTAIGKTSFKRAFIMVILFCIIECVFVTGKYINIIQNNKDNVSMWEFCTHSLLLLLYIFIFLYVLIYEQKYKQRNRVRDRILNIYILCVSGIRIILIISFSLSFFNLDGFCFTVIGQYIYCLIFPYLAFITIRNDSLFWQNLFIQLQQATNTRIHSNIVTMKRSNNDKRYNEYRESFHTLFGDNKNGGNNDENIVEPLVEAVSTIINIIDFSELLDVSDDPIAAGSTAMIHTGYYRNEKVAIKQLYFDELDLSLTFITDLFRESLNSNIEHINIVQFKGVCLRPPELCLIYEYCNCGDLSHLLLWRYYHSKNSIPKEKQILIKEATKIKNRLKILIDISYGMIALHDNFIIHRDLKTDNILIQFDEIKQKFYGKVCDFGSARNVKKIGPQKENKKSWISKSMISRSGVDEEILISVDTINYDPGMRRNVKGNLEAIETTYMTTKVGTPAFMAPELLKHIDIKKMSGGWNDKQENTNNDYVELTPPNIEDYLSINNDDSKEEKYDNNNNNKRNKLINKFKGNNNNKNNKNNKIPFHHNTTDIPFKIAAKNEHEKNNHLTSLYNGAIDVFAFGVIMWEIGFLQRIYEGKELKTIHNMVINGKREYIKTYQQCQMDTGSGFYDVHIDIYNQYINLINQCWAQNLHQRPKFHQIRDKLENIYQSIV